MSIQLNRFASLALECLKFPIFVASMVALAVLFGAVA